MNLNPSFLFFLGKFPFTPAPIPAPEWWDTSEEENEFLK